MQKSRFISKEAQDLLNEIITNEGVSEYWQNKFKNLNRRDDMILRGCFKELNDAHLINVQWADNYPYIIIVLKDGYLYNETNIKEEKIFMSKFEKELSDLLHRADEINSPISVAPIGININEYNSPSVDWINDFEIFYRKYLINHSLSSRIKTILFQRKLSAFNELKSCLRSISKDQDFINEQNGIMNATAFCYQTKMIPEYDVFLSHANKDKDEVIDKLYHSLDKLGIKIFYDKESLEWGDIWKNRILEGTKKSEFAIIVISENFFDREWTEKELNEFLNRQNRNGQKLILPIIHNITNDDLRRKYPSVADIQTIESCKYSCDEIALLFARQLIKRLKS